MAQIVLAPEVRDNFARIEVPLTNFDSEAAIARFEMIIAAIDVLETSPLVGRPVEHGLRELVIGSGSSGFLALYRFASELDIVFVLAIRSQREAGYQTE